MDIQSRKIEFIQEFLKIQNVSAIEQFEKLLKKAKIVEFGKAITPMSVIELNNRIDRSEDDFKNGKYKTSEELLAKYKNIAYN